VLVYVDMLALVYIHQITFYPELHAGLYTKGIQGVQKNSPLSGRSPEGQRLQLVIETADFHFYGAL